MDNSNNTHPPALGPDFIRFSDNHQNEYRTRRGAPSFHQFRGRNRKSQTIGQSRVRFDPCGNTNASLLIGNFGGFRGGGQRGGEQRGVGQRVMFQPQRVSVQLSEISNPNFSEKKVGCVDFVRY